jgi:hypothetical protein
MTASPLSLVFTIEIGGTWLKNVERSLAFHGKNTLSRRNRWEKAKQREGLDLRRG